MLLFNVTGDRDTAALLKLLLVSNFPYFHRLLSLLRLARSSSRLMQQHRTHSCFTSLHSFSLQPCHFDYAVFCPNYTEVSTVGNAGGCRGDDRKGSSALGFS